MIILQTVLGPTIAALTAAAPIGAVKFLILQAWRAAAACRRQRAESRRPAAPPKRQRRLQGSDR